MKRFYSSIILLGIGALIINTQVRFGDGCAGMIGGLSFMFFSVVYIIVLLVILVTADKKRARGMTSYGIYPLITTLVVIVAIVIALNKDKFESRTTWYAESSTSPGYDLTLRENGSFTAAERHPEWTCYYDGKYVISNDTLTLSRHDIQEMTEGGLSDIYLIDKPKNKMYPLDRLDRDTNFWLTIVP
jgi:hypothetical protein